MNVLCNIWETFTPKINITLKVIIVIINHNIIFQLIMLSLDLGSGDAVEIP